MRALKLCTAVLLVLVVCTAASASTPPFFSEYFFSHLVNWDSSRLYTGLLNDGVTPVTPGVAYTPGELDFTAAPGADTADETGWGIFHIDQIFPGFVAGPNNIQQVGTDPIWEDGQGGKEIVGIFYGRTDSLVVFSDLGGTITDPAIFQQTIISSGDRYEIFYQDADTYDHGAAGTAGRIDTAKYVTIGYDAGGALLPGAELVLSGDSTIGDQATEIVVLFNPVGLQGNFSTYIYLDSGTPWQPIDNGRLDMFFPEVFPVGGASDPTDPNTFAHFRLKTTTQASTFQDWILTSSDPLTGGMLVPEPLTMFGVGMAVFGLAGYLRKRR